MLRFSPFRLFTIIAVMLVAFVVLLPSVLGSLVPETQRWIPSSMQNLSIRLGLDLQGGSSLLLEVDEDSVRAARMESLEGEVRRILRDEGFGYRDLGFTAEAVSFALRAPDDRAPINALLMRELAGSTITATEEGFRLAYNEERWSEELRNVITQTIEVIRRRVDETGTNEPTIQQQGRLRILVQLPGLDDPERLKNLLGRTAQLNFHLVDERGLLANRAYPGAQILPMQDGTPPLPIIRRIVVSGETLEDSQATFQDNMPVVSFRFNQNGGRRFAQATTENVDKRLAIVLDNQIISAPVINEPIIGGSGVISGSFSVSEAQDLALLLRAGALPAPISIVEERTVGPSLGSDSLRGGEIAAVVGMVMIAVLMIASYGIFGGIAVVALSANMLLLLAALSVMQATLTLPGLAGLALTIGMAVDANVLILERIREEFLQGKSAAAAVIAGFDRAFITIVDANITTLFAALCLYIFGSGAIRGFAVTLSFGIMTSMFSAVMMTRVMTILWFNRTRPKRLAL